MKENYCSAGGTVEHYDKALFWDFVKPFHSNVLCEAGGKENQK